MAEPILAINGVSKRFGGLRTVHQASLAAETGRITAVIGPNAADIRSNADLKRAFLGL